MRFSWERYANIEVSGIAILFIVPLNAQQNAQNKRTDILRP